MIGPKADALVVGAGIVGAACAMELAQGGLSVLVIDESFPGGGATAAGMGHVVVMDDSEAQFLLTRSSQVWWNEHVREMPSSAEHLACGTLWVAADEEEMEEVRRKHAFYTVRGVPTEILDRGQLEHAEPNLRRGLAGALLVQEDSVVYPPAVVRWMLNRAGIRVIQGRRVHQITDRAALLDDGTPLEAGLFVNAAGCRSMKLTASVPVVPRKGHLAITERYPGFVMHQLVELGYLKSAHSSTSDSVAFNVQPRKTGQVLIGSSRQFGAEQNSVEASMLGRMLRRAEEYLPQIAALKVIRTWTGFRAATPDKLPLIGPCPGYRKVWLATGHEGLGITTAPATGRLLADQVLGRTPHIPVEPYLPSRCMHG
jgi:D-hydroxyproline dehydrogenase subunit beta